MSGKGSAAGGTGDPIRMDLTDAVWRNVAKKCIESVDGIKALLLDDDTAPIVGLVLSHTQALKVQVFAIDKLDNPTRKPMGYIKAVCIIRPSQANMKVLRRELERPNFQEYHLFFTNTLPDHMLKELAQADLEQVLSRSVGTLPWWSVWPRLPPSFAALRAVLSPRESRAAIL